MKKGFVKRMAAGMCIFSMLAMGITGCGADTKETSKPTENTASEAPAESTEVSAETGSSAYPEGMAVSEDPYELTMAFGTSAGSGYVTASIVSQIIMEEYPRYNAKPEITTGSIENINLLRQGVAQIGICMADVAEAAYNGNREFNAETQTNINFIGGGFPTILTQLVPNDSKDRDLKDLVGKKLGVATGTMAEYYFPMILDAYGLKQDDFSVSVLSVNDCISGIKDGVLDGALFVGIVPTASLTEMATTDGFHMMSMPQDIIDKIVEQNPSFFNYVIDSDVYGTEESSNTIATRNILICMEDLDEQVVFDFLTIMFDHQEELIAGHKLAGMFGDNYENVFMSQVIPMHPGAEKFYETRGLK